MKTRYCVLLLLMSYWELVHCIEELRIVRNHELIIHALHYGPLNIVYYYYVSIRPFLLQMVGLSHIREIVQIF